jgi:hypothetical protein
MIPIRSRHAGGRHGRRACSADHQSRRGFSRPARKAVRPQANYAEMPNAWLPLIAPDLSLALLTGGDWTTRGRRRRTARYVGMIVRLRQLLVSPDWPNPVSRPSAQPTLLPLLPVLIRNSQEHSLRKITKNTILAYDGYRTAMPAMCGATGPSGSLKRSSSIQA